ncbi:MAG TPA: NHLP family bacteriocin export ABC transporter peptidase/permease/ATPase subunit [Stellaceae bacterium]|nr:NHLP family bacteriocin export ABC transporter peptidase/permease/ATPase subunit [Stellaceae bacterium]
MPEATSPVEAWPAPNLPPGGRKRFRTPPVLQMENTECGAAALAIILAYHGCWAPLAELRIACGVSRDGSKASNVLRAARAYGLEARGYRRELAELYALPFPLIVFWNFNHFLVVEGVDRKRGKFWLNDPATGPRTVTLDEFDASFTGVCLVFRPTPQFQRNEGPPRVVSTLLSRLAGSRVTFAALLIATLAIVVPRTVIPAFTKIFVDNILLADHTSWLNALLIGMAFIAVAHGGLIWLQRMMLARLEVHLSLDSSARFFWHILRLPIEFYQQRRAGDVAVRVNANDRVAKLLAGELANSLIGVLSMAFFAAVMLAYDPLLCAVAVVAGGVNLLALRAVAQRRENASRRLLKDEAMLRAASVAGILSMETLKSSGIETDFFARWSGVQANYLENRQRLDFVTAVVSASPTLVSALTTAAIIGVGGYRALQGVISIGSIVALQSVAQSFLQPTNSMVRLGSDVQTIKGDLARIDDVLNYPAGNAPPPGHAHTDAAPQRVRGMLEFRDVTFGYSRYEPPLVEGFSLIVRPGQRIALVGGSGSGKSTLARIACGLHQPWSGEVLLDGVPLERFDRARFASAMAWVDQEIFLFDGSVRENIGLWDPSIDDADVIRALADAAVLEVIEARPGRIDSRVLEAGANFSGGQRQRLEIARALSGNPAILILDEATSALDPLVEKRIDENIRRRGCTCIIVAHRLSTIRDADEIIVLERGRIVERGTHEALVAAAGTYFKLVQSE